MLRRTRIDFEGTSSGDLHRRARGRVLALCALLAHCGDGPRALCVDDASQCVVEDAIVPDTPGWIEAGANNGGAGGGTGGGGDGGQGPGVDADLALDALDPNVSETGVRDSSPTRADEAGLGVDAGNPFEL